MDDKKRKDNRTIILSAILPYKYTHQRPHPLRQYRREDDSKKRKRAKTEVERKRKVFPIICRLMILLFVFPM